MVWWKKSSLYLNYWESYDNCIVFMAAIFNFSFWKKPLRMTALHRPRYYHGVLSMHNQKRNKLSSAKNRLPPWLQDHIDFKDKNTKKTHSAPRYFGTRDSAAFFSRDFSGPSLTPFNPELTIVIFIHYKLRIAAAILDLQWMKMTWCRLKIKENYHVLVNQFHENSRSKNLKIMLYKYFMLTGIKSVPSPQVFVMSQCLA